MKDIVLIVGTNLHWVPFFYRYESLIKELGLDYDLIIWNRERLDEKSDAENVYEYRAFDNANNKNPFKFFKFIGFSNFVKKVLNDNKYKKVIFVGTYGCAVAFCSKFLCKNYSNKMWIDIRDDLYEWFKPYYIAQKKTIEASYATSISSPAYVKFLPEYNYLHMHNIDPNAKNIIKEYKQNIDKDDRIRISFIGNVRYYEQNKELLRLLGNDERFIIQYYGKGSEKLEQFCLENNILNVDFCGSFPQKDTIKFYEKTDIINNIYGNNTMNLQLALSNKLYYGLFLKIPLLVSKGTLMEDMINTYNIGFTFDNNQNFPNDLYEWYKNVKKNPCSCRFDDLWRKFQNEDEQCVNELKNFLIEK